MRRSATFLLSLAALVLVMPTSASSAAPERVIQDAYLTAYSWYDNTPPGSTEIAYPKSAGYSTMHDKAGGGGTYDDPITLAVGWSTASGQRESDWPVGKRFYLPTVRKYAVVEDACGDREPPQSGPCHNLEQARDGAKTWIDVWVGGKDHPRSVARSCMHPLTGLHTVVFRPKPNYPVNKGDITDACANGEIYPDRVPQVQGKNEGAQPRVDATRHPKGDRSPVPSQRGDRAGCRAAGKAESEG